MPNIKALELWYINEWIGRDDCLIVLIVLKFILYFEPTCFCGVIKSLNNPIILRLSAQIYNLKSIKPQKLLNVNNDLFKAPTLHQSLTRL